MAARRPPGTPPAPRTPVAAPKALSRSLPFDFGEGVPPRPGGWRSEPVQDAPKGAARFVPFEWDETEGETQVIPASLATKVRSAKKEVEQVLTVSQLAALVKRGLDGAFPFAVIVEGEVVSAKAAASGHVYFSLKSAASEPEATLDVVAYRTGVSAKGRGLVKDGVCLRLTGRPIFWSPRGRLQFVCDRIDAAGAGAHQEALEALRAKLLAEGLFDPDRKKALPKDPRIVGVVTSRTGAVIHDIRNVAFRRGGAHILLAPATVQGATAVPSILRAIEQISRVSGVDVIIVGRGGGSSEDLSAFNDEAIVRALAALSIPVVSAVGHEVDFTLVDFVADARAATPSQAAELVVPDRTVQEEVLRERFLRLRRAITTRVHRERLRLLALEKKVQDPRIRMGQEAQRLDDLRERLERAMMRTVRAKHTQLAPLEKKLSTVDPKRRVVEASTSLRLLQQRLRYAMDRTVTRSENGLARTATRLDALSPLRVLGRGYALAQDTEGKVLRHAATVPEGTAITVRLEDGTLHARVTGAGST